MKRYTRYVLAFLLLLPTAVLANTFNWQGPYVGVYGGGGFGSTHMSTSVGSVTDTSYFISTADINAVNNAGTGSDEPNSIIAGIQMGHDWAWKQIVYGVILDYGMLSMNSSETTSSYLNNSDQYSIQTSMQTNWLFMLRGRVGYETMLPLPSLFYLTVGMSMASLKVNNNFNDNSVFAGIGSSDVAQNQIGWTAGGGIEVVPLQHISLGIEYLYVDIPSVKTMGSIYNTQGGFGIPEHSLINPFATTASFHANIVRIALNYRFDE